MPIGVYERTDAARAAIARAATGKKQSAETREKKRLAMTGLERHSQRGELHQCWKGHAAGYHSKHVWARRYFGKTGTCEHCGESVGTRAPKGTQWASIGHTYTRNRSDWLELCRLCHEAFDQQGRTQ